MENVSLSDKSKESLETEIVKEYLQTGYSDDSNHHDIEVSGKVYKVLDRGEKTTFYDALGNTLFSVDNVELEAEYEKMERSEAANTDAAGEIQEEAPADEPPTASEAADDIMGKACEKLQGEKEKAKDKQFADPVIDYLLKRCEEDNGLAQDVLQKHKTWDKCFDYIFEQARKQSKNARSTAVRDEVVYEWAEDYYHKDDKAEEEKKAREDAERKKKAAERKKKASKKKPLASQETSTCAKKEEAADKPSGPKLKKKSKDIDGQLDLFSMMEM